MSKEIDIVGAFKSWKERVFGLKREISHEASSTYSEPTLETSTETNHSVIKPSAHHIELTGQYISNLWGKQSERFLDGLASDKLFDRVERSDIENVYNSVGSNLTPETLERLTSLVLSEFTNKKRRVLENFEHTQKEKGDKGEKSKNNERVGKNVPSVTTKEKPKNSQKSRAVVLEKIGTAINFSGELTDENFLKEIRKSGSPISEKDILVLVKYLQNTPKRDILFKYRKKVLSGPFKDYQVVRRGKLGRVLFRIDDKDLLHLRVGSHDDIYGILMKVS